MSQNSHQLNVFQTHFKNESSSDSEEEHKDIFGINKKIKMNDELVEESNQTSDQLFAKNAFKPSKSLQILDKRSDNPKKRFSIWSDVLMEEELNDHINSSMNIKIHSKALKIDRNCENYSFWKKKELEDNASHQSIESNGLCLQNHSKSDNNCLDLEIIRKKRKKKNKKNKKVNPQRDIALEIASKLNEPKAHLIRRIVDAIGETKALELCSSTLDIESVGGLMTANGLRRRTSGGVFLQLLKNDPKITKETIDYIFFEEQQVFKRKKKVTNRAKRKLLNKMSKGLKFTENKVESNSSETLNLNQCQEKSSTTIGFETNSSIDK